MIEGTSFGCIIVNGKAYEHDVILTSEGKLKQGRTAARHVFGKQELFELLFERCEYVIVGTGQSGMMEVLPEVHELAKRFKIKLYALPTPGAIKLYNRLCQEGKQVAAYMHVTC